MSTPISIVFLGTPAYAEPALRRLTADERFDVRLVVTQPDRTGGRGHHLVPPRVKVAAAELGLAIFQPASLREQATRDVIAAHDADVFVVAAYGLIFGKKTLAIPRRGCINLHASILPAYRGAAPIPAAILDGQAETGVTLMEMEAGLDTGPIIEIIRTPIETDDTTASLTAKLATLGGELLVRTLPRWVAGEVTATAQSGVASAVRMLSKADGEIDWAQTAVQVERQVRAMWPWPRAWSPIGETIVQVHEASARADRGIEPGTIEEGGDTLLVGTWEGSVGLDLIQLPGGRPISGLDAVKRGQLQLGERFRAARGSGLPLIRPA